MCVCGGGEWGGGVVGPVEMNKDGEQCPTNHKLKNKVMYFEIMYDVLRRRNDTEKEHMIIIIIMSNQADIRIDNQQIR